MPDDRQLRDELERVQGEVQRLKKALAAPGSSRTELHERRAALERSRAQQQAKLADALREIAGLEARLREVMAGNAKLEHELDGVLSTERGLVGRAVRHLDPGPRHAGCAAALALALAVAALGWLA